MAPNVARSTSRRRLCLASPAHPLPIRANGLAHWRPQLQALGRSGRGVNAGSGDVGGSLERLDFDVQVRDLALQPAGRPPPLRLPQPRRDPADQDTKNEQDDHQREKGQRQRSRRMFGAERVERYRDDLPVGDRKRDNDNGERHKDDGRDDFADKAPGRSGSLRQPSPGRLRRSRISLPVLKNGTHFLSTATCAPVRGLRPVRAGRCLTEKAPKPRNSTRSPRDIAATISPSMALTMFSTSRWYRWGFCAEIRWTSSDLIIARPANAACLSNRHADAKNAQFVSAGCQRAKRPSRLKPCIVLHSRRSASVLNPTALKSVSAAACRKVRSLKRLCRS